MAGGGHLHSVEVVNRRTGEVRTLRTAALFSFIGAVPRTDWLPPEIEKDSDDFIRTGTSMAQSPMNGDGWSHAVRLMVGLSTPWMRSLQPPLSG